MQWSERPVILLGNGARGADLCRMVEMGIPILTSWNAKDMIDNDHPMYFGSPGQYGQRIANKVFYEADQIVAIGNRMAIWNVGYEGPRPDQRVVMVDVDAYEAEKFKHADWIRQDAKEFIQSMIGRLVKFQNEWPIQCMNWRDELPLVESPTHDDRDGYINSYRFMERLQRHLRHDEVIVTDMGTAHICAAQVLRLKPPQRFISSGGLGEMGCGLPMAIGASFARNRGEVLCLVGDGGAMMNLQELQTIVHHKLPIKIIVFSNDGYLMIKHTQKLSGDPLYGVDKASGVSCPDFCEVARSFGIAACNVRTWTDFDREIQWFMHAKEPVLMQYQMHPEQPLVPKLNPVFVDGKPTSPRFCDMSPLL